MRQNSWKGGNFITSWLFGLEKEEVRTKFKLFIKYSRVENSEV